MASMLMPKQTSGVRKRPKAAPVRFSKMVAEGEVVVAARGEQGGDVCVRVGVGRGDGEQERDGGAE